MRASRLKYHTIRDVVEDPCICRSTPHIEQEQVHGTNLWPIEIQARSGKYEP